MIGMCNLNRELILTMMIKTIRQWNSSQTFVVCFSSLNRILIDLVIGSDHFVGTTHTHNGAYCVAVAALITVNFHLSTSLLLICCVSYSVGVNIVHIPVKSIDKNTKTPRIPSKTRTENKMCAPQNRTAPFQKQQNYLRNSYVRNG